MSKQVHYVTSEGDVRGPVSEEEILRLRESGSLPPGTRIRISGQQGWDELGKLVVGKIDADASDAKCPTPQQAHDGRVSAGENGHFKAPTLDPAPPATRSLRSLNLGVPLLAILVASFCCFTGMFDDAARITWGWRVDFHPWGDDVVLTNSSAVALHDVTLRLRVINDGSPIDRTLTVPVIDANSEYRWNAVMWIAGNRVSQSGAELWCREGGLGRALNGYSQSLLDPLGILDALKGVGLLATPVLLVVAWFILSQMSIVGHGGAAAPLNTGLFVALVFAGVIVVLLIQTIATCFFALTAESFGVAANHPLVTAKLGYFLVNAVASLKGKAAIVVLVIAALLFVLGGGYSLVGFSEAGLAIPAWLVWAGATLGVGLCEELTKTFLGMLVWGAITGAQETKRERGAKLLMCVTMAHLAFGVGESFHYFGRHNAEGAGMSAFGMRIFWCVPLHTAWGVITGAIARYADEQSTAEAESVGFAGGLFGLIVICGAAIILHGLYDAFCFTNSQLWAWLVGAASLSAAYFILKTSRRVALA